MIVCLQMGQFMHDHIFHQLARRMGEIGVVGDAALPPMARSPERLHATKLPGDVGFGEPRRPNKM